MLCGSSPARYEPISRVSPTQPSVSSKGSPSDDQTAQPTSDFVSTPMNDVVVITGVGGMGVAAARRLGTGRRLVVADLNREKLDLVGAALAGDGFDVATVEVDISQRPSVEALVAKTQS